MIMDTPTIAKLRKDFEESFPQLLHEMIHISPNDETKARYESWETEHAWRAWVSSYETYVGSTMQ